MPAPTDPDAETVQAAGMLLMCLQPEHKFLLLRHRRRWDLPKGHCENDESFLEAALRETEEETGIASNRIRLDETFRFELTYPVTYRVTGDRVFTKIVQYFLGYVEVIPTLRLTEHQSFQWFDWNPPHQIQSETIDPLLAAVSLHLSQTR